MMDVNEDYPICEEVCEELGLLLPSKDEFQTITDEIPAWAYWTLIRKGEQKVMDATGMLYGKDADKFRENMKRTENGEISDVQKKFLEKCAEHVFPKVKTE